MCTDFPSSGLLTGGVVGLAEPPVHHFLAFCPKEAAAARLCTPTKG